MRHFNKLALPRRKVIILGAVACLPVIGHAATPPKCTFGIAHSTDTRYCVSVNVHNGYITVIPDSGRMQIKPGFASGTINQTEIEDQLASYLQSILSRRKLWQFAQKPGVPPPEADQLEGSTLTEAVTELQKLWPKCPDCDHLLTNAIAALPNLCPKSDPDDRGCGLI